MYLDNKIAVVIPCYNVAQHIERVVGSLPDFIDSIVLIDDHSADSTANILASLAAADSRIHLISHSENQGVGGAMISGFNYAMTADIDIVVKIDGDGQMDSAFIAPLLDSMTADTNNCWSMLSTVGATSISSIVCPMPSVQICEVTM